MKKVKFITAIYSNLNNTSFGGRSGRSGHYRWSLLSLLRMNNSDFLCYTDSNEYDSLCDFFYDKNQIEKTRLEIKIFNLDQSRFYDLIQKNKDLESVKSGDRCYEIQYNKFFWFLDEDWSYDYYFWIDAGLSHCGILPDKYLVFNDSMQGYYNSYFFNNAFLEKLTEKSLEKIIIIAKNNTGSCFWSGTVPKKYYSSYDTSLHIIGGLFGGANEKMKKYISKFEKDFLSLMENENRLYFEENIMTLIYYNNKEWFNPFFFDVWWHENNLTRECSPSFLIENKSFYKSLEDIIS